MSDYILPELWPRILQFLPVKSLLQCTAVCKQWHSIITSPSFIAAHLALSRRRPLLLTPPHRSPNAYSFSFNFDTDPLQLSQNLDCPFPTEKHFRLVGSVDGLICLSDDLLGYTYTIIIWNPLIRKSVKLPMPRFSFQVICPYMFVLGFGFDRAKNEYKVVRVAYVEGTGFRDEDDYKMPPLVEVYSLKERRWRQVSAANVEYFLVGGRWTQCFIRGAVHWIGYRRRLGKFDSVVLMFDMETEVFKKMKLPESVAPVNLIDLSISVIGGLLSIIEVVDKGFEANYEFRYGDRICDINIWMMKDYGVEESWAKMLTFDGKECALGMLLHLRTIGGDFLMGTRGGDSGQPTYGCRDIQVPSKYRSIEPNVLYAFSYPESLVLLNKESGGISDAQTAKAEVKGLYTKATSKRQDTWVKKTRIKMMKRSVKIRRRYLRKKIQRRQR